MIQPESDKHSDWSNDSICIWMSKTKTGVKEKSKAKDADLQNGSVDHNALKSVIKKKKKKKKLISKKKKKMSSIVSSEPPSSSSLSSKSGASDLQGVSIDGSKIKTSVKSSKAQCDLCKLSYSSEKELTEHLVSLMHHTKLEEKETNPAHACALCNRDFSTMANYREHIGTKKHKKHLNKLRGIEEKEPIENKKKDKRQGNRQGYNNWQASYSHPANTNPFEWYASLGNSQWNNRSNNDTASFGFNRNWNSGNYGHRNGNFWNNRVVNNEQNDFHHKSYNGPCDRYNNDGYNFYNDHNQYNYDWQGNCTNYGRGDRSNDKYYENSSPRFGTETTGFQRPGGGAQYNNNRNDTVYVFTDDSYNQNFDETWLEQREKLLDDMDKEYTSRKPPVYQGIKRSDRDMRHFPNQQQKDSSSLSSQTRYKQKSMQWDIPPKDRKRHREEGGPESFPKTSKHFGSEIDSNQTEDGASSLSGSQNVIDQPRRKGESGTKTFSQHTSALDTTNSSHKPTLDNTSDNLLERAERLCRELKEKRESSHAWKANLLKSKNNGNIDDKMNALTKKQQSYFKGHITDSITHKSHNDKVSVSEKPRHLSSEGNNSQSLNEPKASMSSTLTNSKGLGKKIEISIDNSRQVDSKAVDSRKEELATIEKERVGLDASTERRAKRVSGEEEMDPKCTSPSETAGTSLRFTSKQLLSKDSLLKMVNSPKSRTERVQLARMLQTRGENKTVPSTNSRTNVNLKGLYDTQANQDIHLDLGRGSDTQVIKLEDLSLDVRSQIMSIIGGDLGDGEGAFGPSFRVSSNLNGISDDKSAGDRKRKTKPVKRTLSSPASKSVSDKAKEPLNKMSHSFRNVGNEDVEVRRKSLEGGQISDRSKNQSEPVRLSADREVIDVDEISRQSHDGDTSLTLNKDNVMNKFPTILNVQSSQEKILNLEQNSGSSLRDSGISSGSSTSKSVPSNSSDKSALSPAFISSSCDKSMESTVPASPLRENVVGTSNATGNRRGKEVVDHADDFLHKNRHHVDDESSVSSSHAHDDSSSETMSQLLLLSEREEEVKQEMMSMELRLTRLHRLLEQAVSQINRCTERRNELHEEEKELTNQRMSLLRAVSSKQGPKLKTADVHSGMASDKSQSPPLLSKGSMEPSELNPSAPEIAPENVSTSEDGSKSSLSKSQWLAKFSAYLPSDSGSSAKVASSHSSNSEPSRLSSLSIPSRVVPTGLVIPAKNLDALFSVAMSPVPENVTHQSSSRLSNFSVGDDNNSSISATSKNSNPLYSVSSSAIQIPSSMHGERTLASRSGFTSADTYAEQSDPIVREQYALLSPIMMPYEKYKASQSLRAGDKPGETTSQAFRHDNIQSNMDPANETGSIKPPPARRPDCLASVMPSPRNEDSDIGSVNSLASGSSLGEKISHLCKRTPGASLDVPGRHDLSVILSGPSDSNDVRGAEDQDSNNEAKKTLYGNLSTEAVKSAEALHLIERNSEGLADTSKLSKENKKKKRKTKHERDTVVNQRRKRYILSSSSEGEGTAAAASETVESSSLLALDSRLRRPVESTNDDSSSDVIEVKCTASSQTVIDITDCKSPSQGVTIAECDSSTNFGVVDPASINAQSQKLKEMNENFIRILRRSSMYKGPAVKDSICGTALARKPKDTSNNLICSDLDQKAFVNLCSDSENNCEYNNGRDLISCSVRGQSVSSASTSQAKQSKFPGTLGSVCYVKVINGKLYAGYLQFGYQVYDLEKETNVKGMGMCLPDLRCMEVVDTGKEVSVFIGQGCNVCCIPNETGSTSLIDLGTEVTCLHSQSLGQVLHVGLDTGEICVLNYKMKKRQRYICCDCPIYSMASGQEGSTRLLCVASMDSSIIVMDSERGLPLRILVGHTKTAFSLQIHAGFVYSGSGDSTVMVHNLHTAAVEHTLKDNKGIVNCVHYSDGYIFTGGMDRLVRCYNTKSHELVQVYYGADMGAIKSICVHDKMLITGNTCGSVDMIALDLKAKNLCPKKGCKLNFGFKTHLSWHLQNAHR